MADMFGEVFVSLEAAVEKTGLSIEKIKARMEKQITRYPDGSRMVRVEDLEAMVEKFKRSDSLIEDYNRQRAELGYGKSPDRPTTNPLSIEQTLSDGSVWVSERCHDDS